MESIFYTTWSPAEVARWLSSQQGIQPYVGDVFEKNKIDGLTLEHFTNLNELKRIGIPKIGTCLRIKLRIEALLRHASLNRK